MILFDFIKEKNNVLSLLKSKVTDYVEILLNPFQKVSDKYDAYIASAESDLKYNGQVIYLEKLLNDRFDNVSRKIYITDPNPYTYATSIIYNIGDNNETKIANIGDSYAASTLKTYNMNDFSTYYNFLVYYPNYLIAQRVRMIKVTNKFKEASKNFNFIGYTPSS